MGEVFGLDGRYRVFAGCGFAPDLFEVLFAGFFVFRKSCFSSINRKVNLHKKYDLIWLFRRKKEKSVICLTINV